MDPWNPIAAETYIKRESFWTWLGRLAFEALLGIIGVWLLAVFILSLDKVIR